MMRRCRWQGSVLLNLLQKRKYVFQYLPCLRHGSKHLKGVTNTVTNIQFRFVSLLFQLFIQRLGIIQQRLCVGCREEHRRKFVEITLQRRDGRPAQILQIICSTAEYNLDFSIRYGSAKHIVCCSILGMGRKPVSLRHTGRERYQCPWLRKLLFLHQ